jgi:hypothetical protein
VATRIIFIINHELLPHIGLALNVLLSFEKPIKSAPLAMSTRNEIASGSQTVAS